MVNDPLSDLIARIKNGYRAGLPEITLPWSRMKEDVVRVLVEQKMLEKSDKQKDELVIKLKYEGKTPALTDIRRVSKPGVRIYSGVKKLPRVLGGLGINILSTPKGIMADKTAKKLHVGGEIIAQVW
ncbi:MAG: SSU ribosomal protein S8P [Candidatus Amesbacteria bacterium GW2011_GWA2_47_11b]|uniref:Small ribosomal subunit protein uS8 n=3 Tax=Candidatus Amesiibacteriota TaxID=1752730 RepID=A0A0G1UV82_9BACT|nr:MAG: SSU ribosomal protein S8P [Microgenomates group bacterium GW2011_GWC1_46_20]KKU57651.1 MAG: SSU ribosomal protein S8P [Candidatus Amesbacteria bacterium GW2011_GWA2_47_11b]KKU69968.1 MAG: SSU ribosomal protein S8P [Candidatus Amesbacteria bacterium GW2011_GWA1_47_20]KKU84074.1 MAG: SSU ribosomal protein S8P [Candidatus Amesbacteria bacterium GW2011_GWC2_47_8]